jgi:hypothetical protein
VAAQRAGTTWWFDLIAAHPAVVRPARKELHFFEAFCERPMTDEDVENYYRAFPREAGQVTGEWTPRYAYDFWTPPLLRRAAPDAKLLFLVRDPLERMLSGIEHQTRLTPPREPIEVAQIHAEAAARGLYGAQLRALLDHFSREQVLLLQYERCVADPAAELRRTYGHLGIDDGFLPDLDARPAPRRRAALTEGLREAFVRYAGADVADLARLVPDLDVGLWANFPHGR